MDFKNTASEESVKTVIKTVIGGILTLLAALLLIIYRDILLPFWYQAIPLIANEVLALSLLTAIVLLLIMFSYILYLKRKLKRSDTNKSKQMTLGFGILWDKDFQPHCPNCQGSLLYHPAADNLNPSFHCIRCKEIMQLADDKKYYSLDEAKLEMWKRLKKLD